MTDFWKRYKDEFIANCDKHNKENKNKNGTIIKGLTALRSASYTETQGKLIIECIGDASKNLLSKCLPKITKFLIEKSKNPFYQIELIDSKDQLHEEIKSRHSHQDNIAYRAKFNKHVDSANRFDYFIEDESNNIAYSACVKLSKRLTGETEKTGDLVLITGISGVGKSHLADAIINFARVHKKSDRCVIFPIQDFKDAFRTAATNKTVSELSLEIVDNHEIIIFDDIDKLSHANDHQIEFIATIIERCQSTRKNVILITKEDPRKTSLGMSIRSKQKFQSFLSRLKEAVYCPIEKPNLELRIRYLEDVAKRKKFHLSHAQAQVIANCVKGTLRDLNGVINNIDTFIDARKIRQECKNETPNELIDRALTSILHNNENKYTESNIIENLVEYFRVDQEELCGNSRRRDIVIPRQLCMWLLRNKTNLTLSKISSIFKRDHSTVSHNVKKIDKSIQDSDSIAQELQNLLTIIEH